MTWSVLAGAGVLLVLLAGAWWLGREGWRGSAEDAAAGPATDDAEDGTAPDGVLPLAFRGYRMDQVDDVLDRLEARIADRDAELAALRGGPRSEGEATTAEATSRGSDSGAPGSGGTATLVAAPTTAPTERDERPSRPDGTPGWPARRPLAVLDDLVHGTPPPLGRLDLVAPVLYLLLAAYVTMHLLGAVRTGYLSQGVQDQQAFEWYFGATAHNLATFSNPLSSDLQNFPAGVNLMANAAVLGLGLPLAPLTLLAGPQATFVLVELLGLALTATGWYWLVRRWFPVHPAAAALAGALAGFGPGMVSHANGHPNFVVQALVPVLVDRLLVLARGSRRPVRDGVVLGLVAAWQVLIGEEVLLLTAVGVAVFGLVLLAHGRRPDPSALRGLGTGVGVALAVTALPLWWQFFGPQSYATIWHPPAGNDLAQLWGRATRTVGADPWASAALSMNRTEENSFFGVALWVAAALTVLLLWRSVVVRALAVVVVVTCWLSLGEELTLHGRSLGVPGPWALLEHVPVVQNVLPTRFALVALPVLGVLLALGADAVRRLVDGYVGETGPGLAVGVVAALLALVPVLPTPLVVDPRDPMPAFFSSGTWRDYVDDGGSVLAVPPPNVADTRALEWQAEARWDFPVVAGYFVGPDGSPERVGQYGASPTGLTQWLAQIAQDDVALPAGELEAQGFEADLRAGRVDALVLPQGRPSADALRESVTGVFGAPDEVGGVYVWDVRRITDGAG
ncbi:DivIVA domain-containing protein [Phycicoccus flavus]|uniref:DivIVA domain-containing protein n=1 Tax=Phycicoccus flavus TaxID=2502783 RepID=UPI000FEC13AF|nr:DivIVA domain-containing protein [Phycicoccus flavus]NHA68741.1 DivIVA domain-containing protein [Phycicoccus flavus]